MPVCATARSHGRRSQARSPDGSKAHGKNSAERYGASDAREERHPSPPDPNERAKLARHYANASLGEIAVSTSGGATIFDFWRVEKRGREPQEPRWHDFIYHYCAGDDRLGTCSRPQRQPDIDHPRRPARIRVRIPLRNAQGTVALAHSLTIILRRRPRLPARFCGRPAARREGNVWKFEVPGRFLSWQRLQSHVDAATCPHKAPIHPVDVETRRRSGHQPWWLRAPDARTPGLAQARSRADTVQR